MPHRGSLRLALAVAAIALSAACGTTVPLSQQSQVGSAGDGGLAGSTSGGTTGATTPSGSTSTGVALPGTTTGGASTAAGGSSGATSGTTGVALPGSTTGSTASASAIPPTGPGWDKTTVYIGALTVNDLHTVAGGLGINLDPGDLEADANAVADYVNKHGGLLGRKVKMLFRDTKTADVAADPVKVGLEACTDFTQDRKVIAVYSPVTTLDTENMRACFAKAHVPIFSAGSAMLDSKAIQAYAGTYYMSTMVAWDKLAPVLVSRLKAEGWFGGWDQRLGQAKSGKAPKLGILTSTTPAGTRVAAEIKDALASAGYPGALVYQWTDASQGQNSSVQYFNGNNVDHIIVADLELTAFQNSAQTQQYKPRYGISTYNDPYTNLESLSPKGANNGALGIGWAPAYDVSDSNDPGITGKGESTCLALNKAAGQNFSGKRTALLFALAACDSILLTIEGAKAGGGLRSDAIYRGALTVAPHFSTAVSFGNAALTPSHLFVSSSARDLAFFTDCSCFRYTSKGATARF
ncbi:MAG: hypothetical protein JWO22_1950 [Frankiales bacterium]|nr:hypothetical protein [Frankiales bacterium]